MKYIDEMFTRTDLQQIRSFLICGVEENDPDNQEYSTRLKNSSDAIYSRLESLYPDEIDRDIAVSDLSAALRAYESVYTEIGMKIGARLLYELLLSDNRQPVERS